MTQAVSRILSWAARNERHLGAVAFVLGFGVDLFTFTVLSVAYANLAFAGYLGLAAVMVGLSHVFTRSKEYIHTGARTISIVAPLVAQYAIGSLLSGFMIFYTKSADISASWPFLLLMAGVFIGNEFFRTYYKHLAFKLALLFFALYAYLIFAVPLVLDRLGPSIFLISSAVAVGTFAIYLWVLGRVNGMELRSGLRFALPGVAVTLLLVHAAYFTGVLPPIPLTMPESGIYHSLVRERGNYVVLAEAPVPWYRMYEGRVVHARPGAVLYAYAATAAPTKFSADVVHKWERFDQTTKQWVTESRIMFSMSGGRPGGFRGYSEYAPKMAGSWRVSVETPNGQVIGRIPFTLVHGTDTPALHEETH